jgi:hypothetical protein
MVNGNLTNSQTYNKFFQPVSDLLDQARYGHSCPELPDSHWIQMGVSRSILEPTTGRGYLQRYSPFFKESPSVSLFFAALKSPRRLNHCKDLNEILCSKVRRTLPDPLAKFDELEKFDVYAGDGHWHGAAAHDSFKDGRKWSVGHFYILDLRSHSLSHMETADEVERKHEHDMRALKRQKLEQLRQKAPKGRKVLYAWDSACIDFKQWDEWKRGGVYFLTRAKENMAFEIQKVLPVDYGNPINNGVLSDKLILSSAGTTLRLIRCEDPATGKIHTFLTNQRTVSAGLLAQIYRMRWDVEKVFDEFKNSLNEQKAWATSENAKTMQANFLCLTHNLMLLMEDHMEKTFDVINTAENQRREERLTEMKKTAAKAGRKVSSMYNYVRRFTKRSVKFIRALSAFFFIDAPLGQTAAYLSDLYAKL